MLMLQLVAMIVEFLKSGGAHVGQDLRVVLEEVSSAVKEERRVVCRGRAGDPGYTWGDEMCLLSSRVRGLLYEAKLESDGAKHMSAMIDELEAEKASWGRLIKSAMSQADRC